MSQFLILLSKEWLFYCGAYEIKTIEASLSERHPEILMNRHALYLKRSGFQMVMTYLTQSIPLAFRISGMASDGWQARFRHVMKKRSWGRDAINTAKTPHFVCSHARHVIR
ncbi:MAG: hypothetical protein K6E59_05205 [Bacilli bacterium]|nr:hypothetical protein [Bacilli bacterium]